MFLPKSIALSELTCVHRQPHAETFLLIESNCIEKQNKISYFTEHQPPPPHQPPAQHQHQHQHQQHHPPSQQQQHPDQQYQVAPAGMPLPVQIPSQIPPQIPNQIPIQIPASIPVAEDKEPIQENKPIVAEAELISFD